MGSGEKLPFIVYASVQFLAGHIMITVCVHTDEQKSGWRREEPLRADLSGAAACIPVASGRPRTWRRCASGQQG